MIVCIAVCLLLSCKPTYNYFKFHCINPNSNLVRTVQDTNFCIVVVHKVVPGSGGCIICINISPTVSLKMHATGLKIAPILPRRTLEICKQISHNARAFTRKCNRPGVLHFTTHPRRNFEKYYTWRERTKLDVRNWFMNSGNMYSLFLFLVVITNKIYAARPMTAF